MKKIQISVLIIAFLISASCASSEEELTMEPQELLTSSIWELEKVVLNNVEYDTLKRFENGWTSEYRNLELTFFENGKAQMFFEAIVHNEQGRDNWILFEDDDIYDDFTWQLVDNFLITDRIEEHSQYIQSGEYKIDFISNNRIKIHSTISWNKYGYFFFYNDIDLRETEMVMDLVLRLKN